jgi:hypothetical protein
MRRKEEDKLGKNIWKIEGRKESMGTKWERIETKEEKKESKEGGMTERKKEEIIKKEKKAKKMPFKTCEDTT